eukprot:1319367-Rhodomonas_salina.1
MEFPEGILDQQGVAQFKLSPSHCCLIDNEASGIHQGLSFQEKLIHILHLACCLLLEVVMHPM